MAAARLGTQLLNEVKEETLDDFLHDLRALNQLGESNYVGVPILDRVLESLRLAQLAAAGRPRGSSPDHDEEDDHDHEGGIRLLEHGETLNLKPAVIEISTSSGPPSLNSPSLRTALCLYLTALAVLPPKRSTAVYICTASQSGFSASQLEGQMISILRSRQPESEQPALEQDIPSLVREALSHVHIFRPSSTTQLQATIQFLPDYLSNSTSHVSSNRTLGLIVLDTIDAFYWQDKMAEEISRIDSRATATAPPPPPPPPPNNQSTTTDPAAIASSSPSPKSNSTTLLSLLQTYSSTLIYTTTISHHHQQHHPPLPQPTIHLSLTPLYTPQTIPQFAPHLSAAETEATDRTKRKQVVQRGLCVAILSEGAEGEWRRADVRERLNGVSRTAAAAGGTGTGVDTNTSSGENSGSGGGGGGIISHRTSSITFKWPFTIARGGIILPQED